MFNIQQFSVLPTQCIYAFSMDLRTNSDYFLYSINWLVFITETECVYCAVRTGSLYINQVNGLPRSIPGQSLSDYGGHSGTMTAFSPSTSFSPCQYHSISVPNSSSCTGWLYQKDKRVKPGNPKKTVLFQKSGSTGQKSASAIEVSI